jgi:hydroxymethylglutaryl-CoA synthase
MELFKTAGNHSVEGVTSINACYGGVAALFNTVAWVESAAWDGRLGIAMASDIAVYAAGPARPTGGVGSIAILIGPDSPIVIDPLRTTFMEHVYDFYKPDPMTEYPTVDGHVSIECYLRALENCYLPYMDRARLTSYTDVADYWAFHTPFSKMIKKAWNKVVHLDIQRNPDRHLRIGSIDFANREDYGKLEKYAAASWNGLVEPSLSVGREIGNIYTGSLFAGLISLITNVDLVGKRVALFSYGSGSTSSLFTITFKPDSGLLLQKIRNTQSVNERLSRRTKLSCEEYTRRMTKRETDFLTKSYEPTDSVDELEDGAFYLTRIDEKWRRFYDRKVPRSRL